MKAQLIAAALILPFSLGAHAFCTDQEAEAKGKQVAAKVNEVTRSDPQRAQKLNEKLADMKKSRSSEERPDDCAAYDEMLKELSQSAPKVDQETGAKPKP
ncbi:hypothetical protein NK553_09005 [Pseudomonas sp. ZM23]|uniref:Uncharacterized protein n=1 Tax=Pseudomonas triclosanedens TaxID=2961893 RepID=A0ABY7A2G7_9PSED|nr:hypothetical protein [Pseudomonas triclosanedens]MCP8464083.1 hypothetical protein [Pseudomonas triclosanedens]MCP8469167.1 hypothetical protein [Pseudomonas triclosanedens]MCP8475889.1 hypothetical protein [Pseudomonas triclosanedens]WAI50410.1 hypothetical protein OU419_03845 [Pseudomonas triclosanedens]